MLLIIDTTASSARLEQQQLCTRPTVASSLSAENGLLLLNAIYMAQIRKNAANAPSQLLQAVSSFCHEECFQPPTKYRQRQCHV